MRKDKKQQKNRSGQQLEFFSPTGEPSKPITDRLRENSSTGEALFSRLERQRSLTENLLDKIVDYENLKRAFEQVRENDGSSGVDEMEVEELRQWLGNHLEELRDSLLTETYQVSSVRKVEIPKPTGGVRMLGIPTVKDRLVQQAIHQKLNLYHESYFSQHSYGFRPNRDAHQAVLQAS